MGGRGSASGNSGRAVHSHYKDGTPLYKGQQPPRLGEAKPDPQAQGAHPS